MKIFLFTICGYLVGTVYGLYSRPDYLMLGQLNWYNVLTKGYFAGRVERFFIGSRLDESFFYVLKFQVGAAVCALILGYLLTALTGRSSKKTSKK